MKKSVPLPSFFLLSPRAERDSARRHRSAGFNVTTTTRKELKIFWFPPLYLTFPGCFAATSHPSERPSTFMESREWPRVSGGKASSTRIRLLRASRNVDEDDGGREGRKRWRKGRVPERRAKRGVHLIGRRNARARRARARTVTGTRGWPLFQRALRRCDEKYSGPLAPA